MNTIFIGGSRHVSHLPDEIKNRIDNVVASGHQVIVGDANGTDKIVQKYLLELQYDKVTVFCSGYKPRNNLRPWRTHQVKAPKDARGFQFYAAKDREMAREADFGLMIWDGKSPGTVLNVLRLVIADKMSVLFNIPKKAAVNIKSMDQWKAFLEQCSPELRSNVKERATPEEQRSFVGEAQPNLLTAIDPQPATPPRSLLPEDAVAALNKALADGDATTIMNALGTIARERGMSYVARETGLARESLYRSLDSTGNPEWLLSGFGVVGLGVPRGRVSG
jgi:probable addiction module antidote protein